MRSIYQTYTWRINTSAMAMKSLRLRMFRVLSIFVLLAVAAGLVAPQPGAAQAPPAQGSLPFYPHTLAAVGQISSSGPILTTLRPSGSWLPITTASLGCGHCGTYVHTI